MAPKVVNRLENGKLFAYFKPCKKYLEFSNYYYSTTARANEHFLADIRWELFFVFYFSSIESTKFLRIITSLHMRFSRGFQCVKFVEIWITAYSISINCCYKMSVFLGKKIAIADCFNIIHCSHSNSHWLEKINASNSNERCIVTKIIRFCKTKLVHFVWRDCFSKRLPKAETEHIFIFFLPKAWIM